MAKRGFTGTIMRATGATEHLISVRGKELIAPGFLRVYMHSDTLFDEAEVVPTAWLRFWFPDPDGERKEHQRAYTIVAGNEATGEFAADFVLHEPAGPASAWAQRVQPGDTIEAISLGSTKFTVPEEMPAGYLLIGDSAAIPGINSIIAVLPDNVRIELYLETKQITDQQIPLTEHPMLVTHWVPRTGPESLADAIAVRDWSNWYAWITPESKSLKHLRTRLRDKFGFPKTEMHVQAYWVEGRAMGKLRDEAKEFAPDEPVPTAVVPEPPNTHTGGIKDADARRGSWRAAAGSRLMSPLKPVFIAAGVLQCIVTLLELAPFVLLIELARRMLAGAQVSQLWFLGIWAICLVGVSVVLSMGILTWLHSVDARFERDLRRRLLAKLGRLPLGWFDRRGSGKVKQLVQDDTLALHYLVTHAVCDAVSAVVAPVAVLVYLFVVDWPLALVLFIPVIVYILAMYKMVLSSWDTTTKHQEFATQMNKDAGEYLAGQPVIRVFGGTATATFRQRLDDYIAFLNDWQRPFIGIKTFMDLVTRPTTFLLLICVVGAWRIVSFGMDPVDLLAFLFLGTTFGSRLLGVGYGLSGLRDGLSAAQRIQVVLEEPELKEPTDEDKQPIAQADQHSQDRQGTRAARGATVEFDAVGFSYLVAAPVLADISLRLEPGTITALVGPSGSGKSTLAELLARFYDVSQGTIRINGVDIRQLDSEQLYSQVGFVFQDAQLVQGTVFENIALAAPNTTAEQVERAARDAQIHDRILAMPAGYDTFLGPDAALSGGERQRLTIARAMLADTEVLVLDEATAFADPESEYLVQRALNRLTADRTVLVIAHRLHTITHVHNIVVLDTDDAGVGRIVETGTHGQLMQQHGRYYRLWQAGNIATTENTEATSPANTTEEAPL